MATDTQSNYDSNPVIKLANQLDKSNTEYSPELHPPENITPSSRTTITLSLVLAPLALFLIGLYFGVINP